MDHSSKTVFYFPVVIEKANFSTAQLNSMREVLFLESYRHLFIALAIREFVRTGERGGGILPPSQPIPPQSHQSSNPTNLSAVIPRVFHHPPAEQATRQRTPAEDFLIFFFK